jgi:phosphatidylserine decarboxylase
MRSPIHPEGLRLTASLALMSFLSSKLLRYCRFGTLFAWVFAGAAAFTAFFFRDPEREISQEPGVIVSPADGKVIALETVDNIPELSGPHYKISIFLSIFNVHMNRAPIEGKVTFRHYNHGKFFPANAPKASTDNEQNSILIDDQGYRVLVRQIAGIVARRILCWVDPGATLARGERFGLIRFGSRTELYIPASSQVLVTVGDVVYGGSSIVAKRN